MASEIESNTLNVQSLGPSNAPTIVFLPGGGAGGWMWRPVVEDLNDYHCLLPDPPEYGGSRNLKPFTIEGFAGLIEELICERANGGRAHVVGLSEGGQVTIALLRRAPERVDHAIVSSALLRPLPGGRWLSSPRLVRLMYRWSVPPFRNNSWWIRINMRYAAGVPEKYYPQFKEDFQNNTEATFTHSMVENQTFRLPVGLERVNVPTLVVVGEKEYAAMRQSARDLVAALPKARGYVVSLGKKANLQQEHNWALNAPEIFAEMTRAWLEGQRLPAALRPL